MFGNLSSEAHAFSMQDGYSSAINYHEKHFIVTKTFWRAWTCSHFHAYILLLTLVYLLLTIFILLTSCHSLSPSISKAQVCSQAHPGDGQRLPWSAKIISIALWWEKVSKLIFSISALPEIVFYFMVLQQNWKTSHLPGMSRPWTPFCCLGLGKEPFPSVVLSSTSNSAFLFL